MTGLTGHLPREIFKQEILFVPDAVAVVAETGIAFFILAVKHTVFAEFSAEAEGHSAFTVFQEASQTCVNEGLLHLGEFRASSGIYRFAVFFGDCRNAVFIRLVVFFAAVRINEQNVFCHLQILIDIACFCLAVACAEEIIGITEGSPSLQVAPAVFNTDSAVEEMIVQFIAAEQDTGFSVQEGQGTGAVLTDGIDFQRSSFQIEDIAVMQEYDRIIIRNIDVGKVAHLSASSFIAPFTHIHCIKLIVVQGVVKVIVCVQDSVERLFGVEALAEVTDTAGTHTAVNAEQLIIAFQHIGVVTVGKNRSYTIRKLCCFEVRFAFRLDIAFEIFNQISEG